MVTPRRVAEKTMQAILPAAVFFAGFRGRGSGDSRVIAAVRSVTALRTRLRPAKQLADRPCEGEEGERLTTCGRERCPVVYLVPQLRGDCELGGHGDGSAHSAGVTSGQRSQVANGGLHTSLAGGAHGEQGRRGRQASCPGEGLSSGEGASERGSDVRRDPRREGTQEETTESNCSEGESRVEGEGAREPSSTNRPRRGSSES